ncbi:MAG TPA: hypothetical protein VFR70_01000 [Flavobacterium sp.]|nr:hypothetical protein [Flavobacterium sp.]
MKKLFLLLTAFFILSSCSDESQESKSTSSSVSDSFTLAAKKGWWCREFTVELSVGFVSISTDVTVCVQPNGYGGWNSTFEKNNGYIKTNELVTKSFGKISSSDMESVIIKSNPEDIDGIKWQVKPDKNKVVTIDNETYLEVTLEKVK